MTTCPVFTHGLKKAFRISILLASAASISLAVSQAALGAQGQAGPEIEREVIPGAEKMTPEERETYRRRMQAASTPEEKAKIRAEYARVRARVAPATLVGDPARGAKLHQACFSCHGIERYTQPFTYMMASFADSVLRASGLSELPPAEPVRFKGRIRSLAALRDSVARRNDFFNPKMTPQEIEDVVAYLNTTYYKFPQ